MHNEQPNFKESYKTATAMLDSAEKNARAAMGALPKKEAEMQARIEEMIDEKAKALADILEQHAEGWMKMKDLDVFFPLFESLAFPILKGFPYELGEKFMEKFFSRIFSQAKLKEFTVKDSFKTGLAISCILSFFGETYTKEKNEEKKRKKETMPNKPLSFSFSEDDFSGTPSYIGYALPEDVAITIEGNSGWFIGRKMKGGTITIKGETNYLVGFEMRGGTIIVEKNAGNGAGQKMKGGLIIIRGNAGDVAGDSMTNGILTIERSAKKQTGKDMKGGTLSIGGEVESFDKTAFSPDNKGTIIWKGVKIFENGEIMPGFEQMNVSAKII